MVTPDKFCRKITTICLSNGYYFFHFNIAYRFAGRVW
jgi:hypothetical protein